jgi:hypothetical protein
MAASDASTTSIQTADVLAIDAAVAQATGADQYGLTANGLVPKPFARLLAEKLALARALFGDTLDLSSGSVTRKLLEISALEDARTWAALSTFYDNGFKCSATGEALSRLGQDDGMPRPFLEASGTITLVLAGQLPPGYDPLTIPRGARLSTPGGHHVATDETVVLSSTNKQADVSVVAFYPGPDTNLNPAASPDQKIDRWNFADVKLADLLAAQQAAGKTLVNILHTQPLTGGELQWPDARYRQLLLNAPGSLWTLDAIQTAVSLVPGVRQAQVRDALGGLDINQSIFGNFNFIERVFGTERNLGSPYYFTLLVAPTLSAIWDGPDGLEAAVETAIADLRPIGIFPNIEPAAEVGVGVQASLVVKGVPLPVGPRDVVNASAAALALKQRLLARLSRYVDGLQFGDPVRASEVTWAIMNEPGIADVQQLTLLRFPPTFDPATFTVTPGTPGPDSFDNGQNVAVQGNQIAVFVDDPSGLTIT